MNSQPTIGVALSGGGHCAALFGLGVLMYLHDAGRHVHVNCISSVSGGSITNGFVGQQCSFPESSDDQFNQTARSLARAIANRGTLFCYWGTWIYLCILLVSLAACFLLLAIQPTYIAILPFFAALGLWARYVLGARGWVCARAFGSTLLHKHGKLTLLADLAHEKIDHVLCATELHCAQHVYFSGRFLYSYRLGTGQPGTLRLQDAVQASAAFPGGFPPRWFRAKRFHFQGGQQSPMFLVVSDGGVYDNMAEQWISGARSRAERPGLPRFHLSDHLILVNSSTRMGWASVWQLLIPLFGEWAAFRRVVDALYENTTAQRRQNLVALFGTPDSIGGTFITIDQTPLTVARQLAPKESDSDAPKTELQNRALYVMDTFAAAANHWNEVAAASQRVKTTLRSLGRLQAANLLYHAYAVANANLHVILGFPLREMPHRSYFEKLVDDVA